MIKISSKLGKNTIFYYYIRKSSFQRFQRRKSFNKFQNHFFFSFFININEKDFVCIFVFVCVWERGGWKKKRQSQRERERFWIQNRNFQRHKQNGLFQDKYVKRGQDLLFTDLQFLINKMRSLPHTTIINCRIPWQLSLRKSKFSDCNEAERC